MPSNEIFDEMPEPAKGGMVTLTGPQLITIIREVVQETVPEVMDRYYADRGQRAGKASAQARSAKLLSDEQKVDPEVALAELLAWLPAWPISEITQTDSGAPMGIRDAGIGASLPSARMAVRKFTGRFPAEVVRKALATGVARYQVGERFRAPSEHANAPVKYWKADSDDRRLWAEQLAASRSVQQQRLSQGYDVVNLLHEHVSLFYSV